MAISYPTSLDSFTDKQDGVDYPQAIHINDVQDAIEALETKLGIDSSGDTNSIDYKVNNFFVSGRKLWLYEDTAPTGWTIVSVTDAVLAVKGGTQAYNTTGGNTAGTWTQPDHTHTIPDHWHDLPFGRPDGDYGLYADQDQRIGADIVVERGYGVGSTGSWTVPSYRTYGTDGGGTTGSSATANTWRPYATVGIIVEKS